MPDDFTGDAPFTSPTFDPSLFENVDFFAAPASSDQSAPVPQLQNISSQDVTQQTTDFHNSIMRIIKDLQSQRSFGGPGLSDIQSLQNILRPRTETGGMAPGFGGGIPVERLATLFSQGILPTDPQISALMKGGNVFSQMSADRLKTMLGVLFGPGGSMSNILSSLSGAFGNQGGDSQVGNIVKAMEALNADNARKQQEALTNQFAALGRSPASTVMADLKNRIAQTQSLANIQGAGEIERLQLPLIEERQRITANLIQSILSQILGGAFNMAGSAIGG